ncbi:MAG: zinc ABC transporter substrate-binding protein [Deltaproteobacteria bacterium]|nr:zinc ABC transporter substrate-binding protein [Deltaproteobacteria bacterium]
MTVIKIKYLSLSILFILIIASGAFTSRADEPVQVTVSILPQRYFVKKIGADFVRVSVIVQPGASPATYEPKPSQMRDIMNSKIYFAIGVPFEKTWLDKFASFNPEMLIIQTDSYIKKKNMPGGHHFGHEHPGVDSDAVNPRIIPDPHIWLSPPLVKLQAETIADALIKSDPSRKSVYEKNLRYFHQELEDLDLEIRSILHQGIKRPEFLVFHPSWGYFADAYGLKQIPVEIEGKEPGAGQMADLIKYAKKIGTKAVFIQPQFPLRNAGTIAREINADLIIADPLSEDWMTNLREVAEKFAAALN